MAARAPVLVVSLGILQAGMALCLARPASAEDHIKKWNGSFVVLRKMPDPLAPQMRQSPADLPRRPAVIDEINGFLKFYDPRLNEAVYVLHADVTTDLDDSGARSGAVSDCVQRGTMGMMKSCQ